MKATPEQLLQIGEIIARCDVTRMLGNGAEAERADAVTAGLITACCILLPPAQWAALLAQCEVDTYRLRHLTSLIPKLKTDDESIPV